MLSIFFWENSGGKNINFFNNISIVLAMNNRISTPHYQRVFPTTLYTIWCFSGSRHGKFWSQKVDFWLFFGERCLQFWKRWNGKQIFRGCYGKRSYLAKFPKRAVTNLKNYSTKNDENLRKPKRGQMQSSWKISQQKSKYFC